MTRLHVYQFGFHPLYFAAYKALAELSQDGVEVIFHDATGSDQTTVDQHLGEKDVSIALGDPAKVPAGAQLGFVPLVERAPLFELHLQCGGASSSEIVHFAKGTSVEDLVRHSPHYRKFVAEPHAPGSDLLAGAEQWQGEHVVLSYDRQTLQALKRDARSRGWNGNLKTKRLIPTEHWPLSALILPPSARLIGAWPLVSRLIKLVMEANREIYGWQAPDFSQEIKALAQLDRRLRASLRSRVHVLNEGRLGRYFSFDPRLIANPSLACPDGMHPISRELLQLSAFFRAALAAARALPKGRTGLETFKHRSVQIDGFFDFALGLIDAVGLQPDGAAHSIRASLGLLGLVHEAVNALAEDFLQHGKRKGDEHSILEWPLHRALAPLHAQLYVTSQALRNDTAHLVLRSEGLGSGHATFAALVISMNLQVSLKRFFDIEVPFENPFAPKPPVDGWKEVQERLEIHLRARSLSEALKSLGLQHVRPGGRLSKGRSAGFHEPTLMTKVRTRRPDTLMALQGLQVAAVIRRLPKDRLKDWREAINAQLRSLL